MGSQDNQSLSAAGAAQGMRDVEPAEIPVLVDELNARYAAANCPYQVVHEGGGYRLLLRNEFHQLAHRFLGRIRQARLSQAAIDVLAIVAYQQPLRPRKFASNGGNPAAMCWPNCCIAACCTSSVSRPSGRPPDISPPSGFSAFSAWSRCGTCRNARNSTGNEGRRKGEGGRREVSHSHARRLRPAGM